MKAVYILNLDLSMVMNYKTTILTLASFQTPQLLLLPQYCSQRLHLPVGRNVRKSSVAAHLVGDCGIFGSKEDAFALVEYRATVLSTNSVCSGGVAAGVNAVTSGLWLGRLGAVVREARGCG